MAQIKAQGLSLAIASSFGASKSMSAVSNANPGVATLESSHGVSVNDIIEISSSGWKRLAQRVLRVSAVATNDVSLEGVNTSSTSNYPTGEGAGTIREIAAWTSLSQLRPDVGVSGGGFRRADITEMDDIRVKEIPTLAEAVTLTFQFNWDASLAWFSVVEDAARAATPTPYRMIIGAARIYGNAYWGFNPEPTIQNGILTGQIELSVVADSKYYAS